LLFARFPVLTLTATSRSSPVSRAQYTSPMPPASSTDHNGRVLRRYRAPSLTRIIAPGDEQSSTEKHSHSC
jgi:hypothetical protein